MDSVESRVWFDGSMGKGGWGKDLKRNGGHKAGPVTHRPQGIWHKGQGPEAPTTPKHAASWGGCNWAGRGERANEAMSLVALSHKSVMKTSAKLTVQMWCHPISRVASPLVALHART